MSNMTFPGVNPIQFGPAHSNGPHNAKKKTLYFIISGEIPEKLGSQRLLAQAHF